MEKDNPFVAASEPARTDPGAEWRLVAEREDEIARYRAELDRQIVEARNERYALEERAEGTWERLNDEGKRQLTEEHRVIGNRMQGHLDDKAELREAQARLDELAMEQRREVRAREDQMDRAFGVDARTGLETRLTEREAERAQAKVVESAVSESRNALHDADYLKEHAQAAMSRRRDDDREIEL